MFGTGISPGFVELMGIAGGERLRPDRQDHHRRGVRHHALRLPETELPGGFGRPIDDPSSGDGGGGHGGVRRGRGTGGRRLGIELDEIVCEAEYARTTEDVVMDSWTIEAGCVAGVAASWQGRVGGRTVVELSVRWKKGQTLDPDWQIEEGHVITVEGRPTVRVRLEYLPRPTSRPRPSPSSWCSA